MYDKHLPHQHSVLKFKIVTPLGQLLQYQTVIHCELYVYMEWYVYKYMPTNMNPYYCCRPNCKPAIICRPILLQVFQSICFLPVFFSLCDILFILDLNCFHVLELITLPVLIKSAEIFTRTEMNGGYSCLQGHLSLIHRPNSCKGYINRFHKSTFDQLVLIQHVTRSALIRFGLY